MQSYINRPPPCLFSPTFQTCDDRPFVCNVLPVKKGPRQPSILPRFLLFLLFDLRSKFCSVATPMDWQKVIRAVGGANVPPDVASGTGGGGASAFSPAAGDLQWRRGRGYVLGLDWEILQKDGQPLVENSGDHPVTDGSHNGTNKDSEADEAYLQVYGFVRGVGMTCR